MRYYKKAIVFIGLIIVPFSAQAQEAMVSTLQLDQALSLDGIVVGHDGTIYGADGFNGQNVYKIQPDGSSEVIATFLHGPIDMDFDATGNLYVSTFNNRGFYKIDFTTGYYEQWASVATGPSGVVVDRAAGKGYISHYGAGQLGNGNTIYVVDLATKTTEVFAQAGGLNAPVSLAIDDEGNVYAGNIVDAKVFKITPEGEMSLLATLPTRDLLSYNIGHLAFANGALYVTGNRARPYVYRVDPSGTYEIIAGMATPGHRDGPGLQARFRGPNGIAASVTGDTLYVTELDQPDVLRVIALPPQATDIEGESVRNESFALSPAYPNPVVHTEQTHTTVTYEVPSTTHVTIQLYDVLGRVRDTLVNTVRLPGTHTLTVDLSSLASGMYFYTLQANNTVLTRSLMVTK